MTESIVVDTEAREVTPTEMIVRPAVAMAPVTLFGSDDPVKVVERASAAAGALVAVVNKQQLYSTIQGKKYPRVEAWTLLGSMLGVFPVTTWTREVTRDGKPVGWEARVEAQTLSGAIVGAAECMCSRDEATWRTRDEHAIRSMAQTRATSKALGMTLRFVMSLAGFEGTPAEEMPAHGAASRSGGRSSAEGARGAGRAAPTAQRRADAGPAPAPSPPASLETGESGSILAETLGLIDKALHGPDTAKAAWAEMAKLGRPGGLGPTRWLPTQPAETIIKLNQAMRGLVGEPGPDPEDPTEIPW
jgi:hypothetical protein